MSKNEFEMRHLKTIAKLYPTMAAATTEIVNLQAILNLPKEQSTSLQIYMVKQNLFNMY